MAGFDANFFNSLPKMAPPPPEPTMGSNPLVAGLSSGVLGLGGSLAGFGGAVGRATGITPLAEGGEDWARRLGAASQAAGIQKYEKNPWSIPGMGYQVAKAVPTLAAFMAGGAALAPAEAPAALAALGRIAPRFLGGAGGATGAVAEKAGAEWARHLIGGGLAGYPLMAGGAYQEQLANGGPDQGKAALALGVGAPEAAIGAVMPAQLRGLAEKGLAGDITKRVLTGGAAAGATNMLQAGVQTALNQPFADPTTPFADRAKEIVKSALLGGAIGGLFGGAGGALGGNKPHGMDTPLPKDQPAGAPAQAPEAPAEGPPGFQQRRWDDATIGNQEAPLPPTPTPLDPGLPFQQRRMGEAEVLPGAPAYTPPEPPRQLTYQPPGAERGFVSPQGDVWPSLGVYDQRNQAPVGYQNELFGQPLQEPLPPTGVPQDRPGYVGPQAPGFDTAGEAPAPLPAVPAGPNLTPQERGRMTVWNKNNPDGTVITLINNLRDRSATDFQIKLAKKLGVKDLVDNKDALSTEQQVLLDRVHPYTWEGLKNAAEVRGPETVATGEPARPVDGVREDNTVGNETPRPGPEEIPAQAPVEGAAETPAPVQEAPAPTAGSVEDRIRQAFYKLAGQPAQDNVRLSALRKELSDIPRADLDAALWSMRENKTAQLMNLDNPRDVKAEGDAALSNPNPKRTDKFHLLWIDPATEAAKEAPAPTAGPVETPAPVEPAGTPAQEAYKTFNEGVAAARQQAISERGGFTKDTGRQNFQKGFEAAYDGEPRPRGQAAAEGFKAAQEHMATPEGQKLTELRTSAETLAKAPEATKPPEAPKPPEPTADEKALAATLAENARVQALAQTGLSARAQELAQMRAERPVPPPVDKNSAIYKAANNIKEPGKPSAEPVAPAAAIPKGGPSLEEIRAKVAAKTAVTEQGVFDLAGQGGDATAALAHIAEHGPSSTSRELAKELQDRVKAAGVQLPMTTGIDGAIPEGWSAASSWNKQTGVITLGRQDHAHEDLMHEVVHPLIYKAAEKNTQGWRTLKGVFLGLAKGVGDETLNDPTLKYAFNAPLPEGSDPAKALHLRTQEFASEVWSNPTVQAYLKSQAPDTWGRLKNAFFRMTGASDKVRSAFDDVMDVSRRVMDEAKALPLTDGRPPIPGHEPTVGSVPHALDTMNKLFPIADWAKKGIQKKFDDASGDPMALGQKLRTFGLGWADSDEMVLRSDKILGGNTAKWMDARKYGCVVTDRFGQMALPVRAAAIKVAKESPQANKVWDSLRSASPRQGFDYRKWASEQPEVFEGMAPQKAEQLKAFVDDARRQWESISKIAGPADDMMRQSGQIANNVKMGLTLDAIYRRFYSDRNLPSFALDPLMELTQHPDMLADLPKTVAFTRDALTNRLKEMETLGAANAPDVVAMRERAKAIDSQIAEMTGSKTQEAIKVAQATLSGLKGSDPAMSKSLRDHINQLKASMPTPDEKTLDAIKAAKEQSAKTHQEVQTLTDYQTGLSKTVKSYQSAMEYADKTPFFHLGRDGDHFASMRLKTDQTGALDPAAADRLGQLLQAKGMDNIVIDRMNENNHFFTRVDSRTQRKTLEDIAAVLQKEGWLAPDKVDPDTKVTTEHAFSSGEVGQMDAKQFGGVAPAAVERLLSQIAADHSSLPPEVAGKLMGHVRSIYLDMLPKNSMVRLFEPRQGLMGHRGDMTANFDQYQTQFANAAGRMWSQPRVLDALSGMADAVDGYKHDLNSGAMKDVASAYAKEIMTRETGNTPRSGLKWQRDVLAANHAYFLTLSPAYTTELLLQVPMLLHPQLGRKYGYLQSASSIAGATNDAFKVVRALIKSGHGSDAFLTPNALTDVGMSPGNADFAMQVANRGGFELGSWTHAVTGDAPTLARSNVMQALNTFTVASEVFPRALAAFAAKGLHESDGGKKARMGLHDYVDETLAGSNYNWQTDLQARHLGAGGFAGPLTPLVTKFMSYQSKSLHRLYREVDTAFGGMADERTSSPEEAKALKAEARRYLAGHLSAVTMLAGSLGLPILPVAASAASLMANFLTGDDRYDAERWYRSHLQDAFGPVVAEAIAKGVPRLAGMDLSEHAGEERLLPFSDMLTDKRKWADVFSSASFHALGSPFSMGANFIKGGTDIYNGRILNGLQEALPSAAKNFVRAFRMGAHGYEAPNGVKLPIGDPSAADIAMQVVGITPAKKAAYDEAQEALRGLQDRRQIISQNLGANMVTAFNQHDPAALRAAQADTMSFVQTHPWMAGQLAAPIQHAVRSQAMGQAFGVNNINPRDQGAMRLLRAYGGMP